MSNVERLTYRSSKQAISFAWRTVILSIAFGSAIFIILPLTAKKAEKKEKVLVLTPAPEKVKIDLPEKEKIHEKKSVVKNKEAVKKQVVPTPPEAPQPPAAPVKIKMTTVSTNVSLQMDTNITPQLNFKVEKIQAIKQVVDKPITVKKVTPIDTPPAKNYDAIFSKSEVDSDAQVIKDFKPRVPRRLQRRVTKGSMVTIRCVVSKEGKLINPVITYSRPSGIFDDICLDAIEKRVYKPAMLDGKPVAQRLEITFDFGSIR